MTANCTITIHMVTSLDGFIAKKDNSVSWFETTSYYEKGIELTDKDKENHLKTIDCYVMGSHTYEHALELSKTYGWAYGDTPTFVVSSRLLPVERKNVELFSGDLNKLVNDLQPKYKNVWVVGGSMLVSNFIRLQLAYEIRLTIIPVILGEGLPFFNNIQKEYALHLEDITAYKNGMVELWYKIKKDKNNLPALS